MMTQHTLLSPDNMPANVQHMDNLGPWKNKPNNKKQEDPTSTDGKQETMKNQKSQGTFMGEDDFVPHPMSPKHLQQRKKLAGMDN